MTIPLDYIVKKGQEGLERLIARYLPSWEGGAAVDGLAAVTRMRERIEELDQLINTPQTADFIEAIKLEAAHQQLRWGTRDDAGKQPTDWFWLLGYLSGKAVTAFACGDRSKGLHHIISSAAALLNWHRHATGEISSKRPGIDQPKGESNG